MSLVETLATVLAAAVLVSMAVPSYREYTANSDISSATNLFLAHLNAARNEAVTRGTPVAMCVSRSAAACSGDTSWGSGWIMFTDADGEPGILDGVDQLLRVAQDRHNGIQFDTESSYIRFGTMGEIDLR